MPSRVRNDAITNILQAFHEGQTAWHSRPSSRTQGLYAVGMDPPLYDGPLPKENRPREETVGREYKVPAGEAPTGRLVLARNARAGVSYRCPGCRCELVLRRGEVRSPHFSHKAIGSCSPETALHQGVKAWVALMLRRRLRGLRRGVPRLRVPCRGRQQPGDTCDEHLCPGEAWLHLADLDFDQVMVEEATPDGLRPDVLLLKQGSPVLGIEVLVTHAVDAAKAAKTSHPWVEVDGMQILRSPGTWKPSQASHPWTGSCHVCAWADRVMASRIQDWHDPADLVSQLAAAFFEEFIQAWLHSSSKRIKPALFWRCPWCRIRNRRLLRRDLLRSAAQASSLVPPCEPEVVLEPAEGPPIAIAFGFPRNPARPWQILPLPDAPGPRLRATPDPKHPHRLALNGTNRPSGFPCRRCGRDCLGSLPSPWIPAPWWEG
jgi:hypothetical protein